VLVDRVGAVFGGAYTARAAGLASRSIRKWTIFGNQMTTKRLSKKSVKY